MSYADRKIVEDVVVKRMVVVRDLTYYVYCTNMASWWQLESPTAGHELTAMAGINAPVNYHQALARIYPLLSRVVFPVGKVEPSICVGTYRLAFTIEFMDDGPIVNYKPHKTIIENPRGDMYRRMYMVVTCPIVMPYPFPTPKRVVVDLEGQVLNDILLPLTWDQKIDCMWRIGRAIMDPRKFPCVILFYGQTGEEGKTALAMNLSRVIGTGVEWTVCDLIGKGSKWPNSDEVMKLAQKKVIVNDECAVEEDFNYNNIKRWTSCAPVQSSGGSAYLSQTIIGISNKIGFMSKSAINNSIGRRLVIYKMDKELGKLDPFPEDAITPHIRFQFISTCVMIANTYEKAPMSLELALYTVFRRSVNIMTADLIIDYGASDDDFKVSTAVMAIRAGVSIARLVGCFAAMSPRLVCEPKTGSPFVVGLTYTKRNLTRRGVEYVRMNWGKETLDLDTLKETARVI